MTDAYLHLECNRCICGMCCKERDDASLLSSRLSYAWVVFFGAKTAHEVMHELDMLHTSMAKCVPETFMYCRLCRANTWHYSSRLGLLEGMRWSFHRRFQVQDNMRLLEQE